MKYNRNDHSQILECPLSYILKYMKAMSCTVKQLSQRISDFQPFPEAEAYGKIPAHDYSVLRNPCSRSYTGKLKSVSIVSFLQILLSVLVLLSTVLQKLQVV